MLKPLSHIKIALSGLALIGMSACDLTTPAINSPAVVTPNYLSETAQFTQLVFLQEPSNSTAGSLIPSIQVAAQNSAGTTNTLFTGPITISISSNPSSGTLSGTTTVTAVDGVATFSNLSINKVGLGYSLSASSGNVNQLSNTFNVVTGSVAKIVFANSIPTTLVAGQNIAPSVVLEFEDANGNIVTTSNAAVSVALSSNSPAGSVLFGTSTLVSINGKATFSGLNIHQAGAGYSLVATSGLFSATSNTFSVGASTPAQLAFQVEPSNTVAGNSISPNVQLVINDIYGNLTSSAAKVTVSIGTNPAGGTLTGGGQVQASSGQVGYPGMSINTIATGYTLSAYAQGLTSATSTPFNITPGPPVILAYTTNSQTVTAGSCSGIATVQTQDLGHNSSPVTNSLTVDLSASVAGATFFSDASCLDQVNSVTIAALTSTQSFYFIATKTPSLTITASASDGSVTQTQQIETVLPGPATKLVYTQQPAGFVDIGTPFTTQPIVKIEDTYNNTVTTSSTITLTPWLSADCSTTHAAGTLSNASMSATGIAIFSSVSDNTAEKIYLLASDGTHKVCSTSTVTITSAITTVTFNPPAETTDAVPTTITATFSQPMNVSTLIASNFSMSCTASGAYTISSVAPAGNGLSAVVTLSEAVAPVSGEVCTLHLSNTITDVSGNTLSGTTSVAYTLDTVAPTVIFNPATGVVTSIPASITATFSKAMLASSVTNAANWSMGSCTGSGAFSISSVTYNSGTHVATVNLSQSVAPSDGSICTLTPTASAIFDTSGNALTANDDALTVDSTIPSILSFNPPTSNINAVPSAVLVTFSKAMQSATVTNSSHWSVSCNESGAFTISTVTYNSGTDVATVNLSQSVAPANGEICTLTPNASAIQDNADVGLSGSPSVAYTIDTTAPTVVFTPPTSVRGSIPSSFSALFSKAMGPASTGNTANWSVSCTGSGVYTIASVTLSTTTHTDDTATVTLSQTTPATNGAVCTLTASTSILDSSGNALTGNRISAITLDTTTPMITAFSPAAETINAVPLTITATFNDSSMNPTKVQNTANWSVSCTGSGSYSVSGVSLSGMVATVSLTQGTAPSTGAVCTLTASTNIQNLVGTALSGTRSVAYTINTTPPTVISETPASAATQISVGTTVVAKFSQPMTSATLNTTNFTVTANGGSQVAGTVVVTTTTYPNDTVTFTPTSALAESQQYNVSLSTGITDSYGNALASTFNWSFTTIGPICDNSTTIGHTCSGGGIFAGSYDGHNYMTTISNCTNSTCTNAGVGGTDTLTTIWGTNGITTGASNSVDGSYYLIGSYPSTDASGNTYKIIANDAAAAAAQFCHSLNYGGYTDWYLPALNELSLLYTNRTAIGGFNSSIYWSSTEVNANQDSAMYFTTGSPINITKNTGGFYGPRCVRAY